ncbi:hypothetical protein P171DRAFT_482783 [Karstenula rhodostoma CBS 690.94]|uniref:Uncharacterized protein n=1 Tax=Karstenula rhodostoma CBS 690.94 TaxID=1392251 RepID=A0A9P4PNW5_9PLEO|nr:hypothetical protein P171DRAFT_482783 [Karstenula rhodostoma CBS 690.94]
MFAVVILAAKHPMRLPKLELKTLTLILNKAPPNNYHAAAIEKEGGFRTDLKPINITQPEGVSFSLGGHRRRADAYVARIGREESPALEHIEQCSFRVCA